jgi:glycosyltransferase involved in cell wall biosynthesis
MSKKFSIITPSYNSGKYIEEAILSVSGQEYNNFEHIVVDGGSEDNTLEILHKYPHVKWISEPDKGQSHAMNKGFSMSSGEIIGYLNADDYYLPAAFKTVLHYFEENADFAVGKVKVLLDDGSSWINDPKVTHWEMLHHWQPDAFCVNPAGYFYSRRVQEKVKGFNENNTRTMDLEFLLAAARDFELIKINRLLGVFRLTRDAKSILFREDEDIWSSEFFSYIDGYLDGLSREKKEQFIKEREEGYSLRKKWQRQKDQKIAARDRLLEEKDRLLQQKDRLIAQKNIEFDWQKSQLDEKLRQIALKEQQLQQNDRQLEDRDKQLQLKDEQVKQQNRQINEKEQQLQQKNQQVEQKVIQLQQKDEQIAQRDRQLQEKEQQLQQKNRQLSESDVQLQEKKQQLRQKDEQIEHNNRQLQEKDAQVVKIDRELKEKTEELTEETELLKKSNRDLHQKSLELTQMDTRLTLVLNSKSFRVGKFILAPFTLIKRIIKAADNK